MIPFSLHTSRLSAVVFALALGALPAASPAQDTSTGDAPAASAQPAQPAQPPQPYFKEDVGDWRIRCVGSPVEGQPDVCQLYQLLRDSNNNPVSEFTILPSPDGPEQGVLATIVTPLETLLTPGLRLSIDDGPEQAVPFTWCNNVGCYAR
ncbi:MAG: invasion associated locus B family protein, partial [Pseudomonadota bacterium]